MDPVAIVKREAAGGWGLALGQKGVLHLDPRICGTVAFWTIFEVWALMLPTPGDAGKCHSIRHQQNSAIFRCTSKRKASLCNELALECVGPGPLWHVIKFGAVFPSWDEDDLKLTHYGPLSLGGP